jgi:hypothetical protein
MNNTVITSGIIAPRLQSTPALAAELLLEVAAPMAAMPEVWLRVKIQRLEVDRADMAPSVSACRRILKCSCTDSQLGGQLTVQIAPDFACVAPGRCWQLAYPAAKLAVSSEQSPSLRLIAF